MGTASSAASTAAAPETTTATNNSSRSAHSYSSNNTSNNSSNSNILTKSEDAKKLLKTPGTNRINRIKKANSPGNHSTDLTLDSSKSEPKNKNTIKLVQLPGRVERAEEENISHSHNKKPT